MYLKFRTKLVKISTSEIGWLSVQDSKPHIHKEKLAKKQSARSAEPFNNDMVIKLFIDISDPGNASGVRIQFNTNGLQVVTLQKKIFHDHCDRQFLTC